MKTTILITSGICLGLAACSAPKPVLYPNAHLNAVGPARAQADISNCRELAEAAGTNPADGAVAHTAKGTVGGGAIGAASGAVGGAIAGGAGRGAMIGAAVGATAGFLRSAFSPPRPSSTHVNYVNRCLSDRGYETIGWD